MRTRIIVIVLLVSLSVYLSVYLEGHFNSQKRPELEEDGDPLNPLNAVSIYIYRAYIYAQVKKTDLLLTTIALVPGKLLKLSSLETV